MLRHQWHLHLVILVHHWDLCCIRPRLLHWLPTSQCLPLRLQFTIPLSILVSLPSMAEFLAPGGNPGGIPTVSGVIPPAIPITPVALPFLR